MWAPANFSNVTHSQNDLGLVAERYKLLLINAVTVPESISAQVLDPQAPAQTSTNTVPARGALLPSVVAPQQSPLPLLLLQPQLQQQKLLAGNTFSVSATASAAILEPGWIPGSSAQPEIAAFQDALVGLPGKILEPASILASAESSTITPPVSSTVHPVGLLATMEVVGKGLDSQQHGLADLAVASLDAPTRSPMAVAGNHANHAPHVLPISKQVGFFSSVFGCFGCGRSNVVMPEPSAERVGNTRIWVSSVQAA